MELERLALSTSITVHDSCFSLSYEQGVQGLTSDGGLSSITERLGARFLGFGFIAGDLSVAPD